MKGFYQLETLIFEEMVVFVKVLHFFSPCVGIILVRFFPKYPFFFKSLCKFNIQALPVSSVIFESDINDKYSTQTQIFFSD